MIKDSFSSDLMARLSVTPWPADGSPPTDPFWSPCATDCENVNNIPLDFMTQHGITVPSNLTGASFWVGYGCIGATLDGEPWDYDEDTDTWSRH